MSTEMELTLEQTQQGVSYEVSYDESNTYVLERFNTTAGNPVKEILLKLNLPDHRIRKDGGEVRTAIKPFKTFQKEKKLEDNDLSGTVFKEKYCAREMMIGERI
ncbi:hypothetical protein Tco_0413956 [Tanacetum coccineum]